MWGQEGNIWPPDYGCGGNLDLGQGYEQSVPQDSGAPPQKKEK